MGTANLPPPAIAATNAAANTAAANTAATDNSTRQIHVDYVSTPKTGRLNLAAHHHLKKTNRSSRDQQSSRGGPAASPPSRSLTPDEHIREKTRMASALSKLGINMGKEVMDHWMNDADYDGVNFGSMAVLYEIKLKELLATLPRTIDAGNYPNKIRTALVLGIFRELASSKALGKFQPLLASVLSTVIDAIYVPSVRNYADGSKLNSQDYGKFPTWYEMARSQTSTINALQEKLRAADLLRRRFLADKRMQQALLTRTIDRWRRALMSKVYQAWVGWFKQQKRIRRLIQTVFGRKFLHRDRELMRRCHIAWRAYARSLHDQRLSQDGWSDIDAKDAHDMELEKMRDSRDELLFLLKKMVIDFKAELGRLQLMFETKMSLALVQQASDLKQLVDVCRDAGPTDKIKMSIGTQVGMSSGDGSGELLSEGGDGKGSDQKKEKMVIKPPVELNVEKKKKKKKKKKYKGRTLTVNKVLDIIAGMWEKKIRADMVDDAAVRNIILYFERYYFSFLIDL